MFLTEKAGGSDVGANLVEARLIEGRKWALQGEKWFCSNANAQIIFALARTRPEIAGTRGLGIFLLEPQLPDGSPNHFDIVRLKDKLGVRSMASGEFILQNAQAKLVGGETEGFKIMTDMINLSRLYNSVAALGGLRRALVEAYQFLSFRLSFGRPALQHPLIRTKLEELGALHIGYFYLTWRAIEALDAAENGNEQETALLRLLTPMLKKATAEGGVYIVREAMELMGGMGYIEDGVMPKIMRDVLVLPIWEGAGNIMVLDMLRAALKSEGLSIMLAQIQDIFTLAATHQAELWQPAIAELKEVSTLFQDLSRQDTETLEASAKPAFERLTRLYTIAAIAYYANEENTAWTEPALHFLLSRLSTPSPKGIVKAPTLDTIQALMGWQI